MTSSILFLVPIQFFYSFIYSTRAKQEMGGENSYKAKRIQNTCYRASKTKNFRHIHFVRSSATPGWWIIFIFQFLEDKNEINLLIKSEITRALVRGPEMSI